MTSSDTKTYVFDFICGVLLCKHDRIDVPRIFLERRYIYPPGHGTEDSLWRRRRSWDVLNYPPARARAAKGPRRSTTDRRPPVLGPRGRSRIWRANPILPRGFY